MQPSPSDSNVAGPECFHPSGSNFATAAATTLVARATEFDVRGKFSCSGSKNGEHGSFSNREDTFYHRGNVGRKCVGPSTTVPSELKSQTHHEFSTSRKIVYFVYTVN